MGLKAGKAPTQAEIDAEMKKSYEKGYSAGQSSSTKSDTYNRAFGKVSNDIIPAVTMLSGLPFGLGTVAATFSSVVNELKVLASPLTKTQEFLKGFEEVPAVSYQRDLFLQFKEELGDINRLSKTAQNETTEAFRQSRENIINDYVKTVDELEASKPEMILEVELDNGEIQKMNLLQAGFEGLEEVQKEYYATLTKDIETYGNIFARQLKGQETEIARYTKGFNFTTEQTSTFLKRQLDLTGTAGTEMLDDLQTYSTAVADATGVSFKVIAKTTEKIIADVENFGNVTVDEATRIAGALNKTGISFEKFSSMVGNFQSFDSAAGAVSNLTAVFGVQLDTMDLMMKANEDQEGFLHTLRDSFLDQGLAIDDLNLSQKKLLASQLQMGVSDVEKFFREGLMPDQEALEAATDTASAEDAIQRLNDGIVTLMDTGASAEEVLAKGLQESLIAPLSGKIVDMGTNISSMAIAFRDQILKANQAIMQSDVIGPDSVLSNIGVMSANLGPEEFRSQMRDIIFKDLGLPENIQLAIASGLRKSAGGNPGEIAKANEQLAIVSKTLGVAAIEIGEASGTVDARIDAFEESAKVTGTKAYNAMVETKNIVTDLMGGDAGKTAAAIVKLKNIQVDAINTSADILKGLKDAAQRLEDASNALDSASNRPITIQNNITLEMDGKQIINALSNTDTTGGQTIPTNTGP